MNRIPIARTAEILALHALGREIDSSWVDWAVEMLAAGFNSRNLAILAGETKPLNQFAIRSLTDRVLAELQLDHSDKERTIKNYVCYLMDRASIGEIDRIEALRILKDIYLEIEFESYLHDFYLLYFAKTDLNDYVDQHYWDGATRENIDQTIDKVFEDWKFKNCENPI